jgi:starch phosphorylase
VPAGHDSFDLHLVAEVLSEPMLDQALYMLTGRDRLDMSRLALNLSHYVNGVARSHGEVAQHMFPGHEVQSITNGVHSATWTCPSFGALFDRQLPGWREDPAMLRRAMSLQDEDLLAAHAAAKLSLVEEVERRSGQHLDPRRLTLGFARRATAYKRTDLLFRDLERLRRIGRGRLQLVFAGKAHPRDGPGKGLIRQVFDAARSLGADVPLVYLSDYDLRLARTLVAGVDVWLNTPSRPLEASGTSGMKAAHNGVPSLSVLDGWWREGWLEDVTGWAIGTSDPTSDDQDAAALYQALERSVLPRFESEQRGWAQLMRQSIALNASFFNTHRVVQQYVTNAYLE